MKKFISLSICFALLMAMLSGCGKKDGYTTNDDPIKDSITQNVPSEANTEMFPKFQTTDLSGNPVDSSIFSENKLTMLNIWGTFCEPCIAEMPDLAKMSENMPEGTAIVGLVTDALDEKRTELAKKIVADTGVKYTNLITDDALTKYVNEYAIGVPMTIFIDSSGNIVGGALIGAKSVKVYKKELETRLSGLADAGKSSDTPSGELNTPDKQTEQSNTPEGLVHTDFTLNCSFQNKEDQSWSEKPGSFSLDLPADWQIAPPKGEGTQFFASYNKGGANIMTTSLRHRAAGTNPLFQELFSDIDSDNTSSSKDLELAGYPARLYKMEGGSGWFVIAPNEFSDMYIEVSYISAAVTEEEMKAILSTLSLK